MKLPKGMLFFTDNKGTEVKFYPIRPCEECGHYIKGYCYQWCAEVIKDGYCHAFMRGEE